MVRVALWCKVSQQPQVIHNGEKAYSLEQSLGAWSTGVTRPFLKNYEEAALLREMASDTEEEDSEGSGSNESLLTF